MSSNEEEQLTTVSTEHQFSLEELQVVDRIVAVLRCFLKLINR